MLKRNSLPSHSRLSRGAIPSTADASVGIRSIEMCRFFNGIAASGTLRSGQPRVDRSVPIWNNLRHDSPLAGSFSWLLLGAGKPPSGRFSHFWGTAILPSPRQ